MKQKKSLRQRRKVARKSLLRDAKLNITSARQRSLESKLIDAGAESAHQLDESLTHTFKVRELKRTIDEAFKMIKGEKLTPGDAPHLFAMLHDALDDIKRIDKENPTGPDELTDPRIIALLYMCERITEELDPLVRENYKDNPEKLAKWEDIMKDYGEAGEQKDE